MFEEDQYNAHPNPNFELKPIDYNEEGMNAQEEDDMISYYEEEKTTQKIRFKGKKNPNNPRELLAKADKIFISKKANYVDCASCYCCIGENIYKIYKYKSKNETEQGEEEGVLKPFTHHLWDNNIQFKKSNQMEGGEKESQDQPKQKQVSRTKIAPGGVQSGRRDYNSGNQTGRLNIPIIQNNRAPSQADHEIKEDEQFIQPPPLAFDETQSPAVLQKQIRTQNPYNQPNNDMIQEEIPIKKKGQKGKRILKLDEDSILCPMVFCPAACRPYSSYAVSSNGIFELARFFRNYKCTFMGYDRPEILVYRTEFLNTHDNSHAVETFLGKAANPLCCGSQEIIIYESISGELQRKFQIQGDACQTANCCPAWLCSSSKARFYINDIKALADPNLPNQVIRLGGLPPRKPGKIEKIYSSFIKEFFSNGHHYKIRFPENCSIDQKILILAGFQLLDMAFYDKKGCFPGMMC